MSSAPYWHLVRHVLWGEEEVRCLPFNSHLHGAHVKATEEELQGDDEVKDGAVHVCRCATVPGEHRQEASLLWSSYLLRRHSGPIRLQLVLSRG